EGSAKVELQAADHPPMLTLELTAGASVSGYVRERGGGPLAGASVSVWAEESEQRDWREVKTDSAGRYAFKSLPGGRVELRASAPGRGGRGGKQQRLPRAGSLQIDLERERDAPGRGAVLDEAGKPLPGARLFASVGAPSSVTSPAHSQTDGH